MTLGACLWRPPVRTWPGCRQHARVLLCSGPRSRRVARAELLPTGRPDDEGAASAPFTSLSVASYAQFSVTERHSNLCMAVNDVVS